MKRTRRNSSSQGRFDLGVIFPLDTHNPARSFIASPSSSYIRKPSLQPLSFPILSCLHPRLLNHPSLVQSPIPSLPLAHFPTVFSFCERFFSFLHRLIFHLFLDPSSFPLIFRSLPRFSLSLLSLLPRYDPVWSPPLLESDFQSPDSSSLSRKI